jgi:hypothetical protein
VRDLNENCVVKICDHFSIPTSTFSTSTMPAILLLLLISISLPGQAEDPAFSIQSDQAKLDVFLHNAPVDFDPTAIQKWIQHSANIVTEYYGQFPTAKTRIDLDLFPGGGITGGTAYGTPRARIALTVGQFNSYADLQGDWRLIHEMVHLALPRLDPQHHWLEEGLATYVESIIRAQAGDLTPTLVWKGLHRGLPHGLPVTGETGLDGTLRWGRVYWGGALFAFYADMMIREKTNNELSLQHALKGILAAGLTHENKLDISRLFTITDQATSTNILSNLYTRSGSKKWLPDLDQLWKSLGLTVQGDEVSFNNKASKAQLRLALLARQ